MFPLTLGLPLQQTIFSAQLGHSLLFPPLGILKLEFIDGTSWYIRYHQNYSETRQHESVLSCPTWLHAYFQRKGLTQFSGSFLVDEKNVPGATRVVLQPSDLVLLPFPVFSLPSEYLKKQLGGQLVFQGAIIPILLYGQLYFFQPKEAIQGVEEITLETEIVIVEDDHIRPNSQVAPSDSFSARLKYLEANSRQDGKFLLFLGKLPLIKDAIAPPVSIFMSSVEADSDTQEVHEKKLLAFTCWQENLLKSGQLNQESFILIRYCEHLLPNTIDILVASLQSLASKMVIVMQTTCAETFRYLRHLNPEALVMENNEPGARFDSLHLHFEREFLRERQGHSQEEAKSIAERNLLGDCDERISELVPKGLTTWDDLFGYHDSITRVRRLIDSLSTNNTDRLKCYGLRPVKGILLYGPSGCGKTAISRAIATSSRQPMLRFTAADVLSRYFGESETRLRRVFAEARQSQPCYLLIDNIEALGRRRGSNEADTTGVSERLLSTLLNEMDGIEELIGVTIIACTRRKEELDDALLRPGRLDHHVELSLPTEQNLRSVIIGMAQKLQFIYTKDILNQVIDAFKGYSTAKVISAMNQYAFEQVELVLPLNLINIIPKSTTNVCN